MTDTSPTPQKLAQQAGTAYKKNDYAQAVSLYQAARRLYHESGDDLMAAEMDNNISVTLLKMGDADAALQAAEGTDAVFLQAGDLERQGIAIANQAAALEAQGKLAEALERYQLSSEVLKQAGSREMRSFVLQSISALQLRTGHQLQALASMDTALEHKAGLSFKERFLKRLLKTQKRLMK